MKKILTLFAAVIVTASMWAQSAVNDTVKTVVATELTSTPGVAGIMWDADSTISQGYYVMLGVVDMTVLTAQPFIRLASTAKNFGLGTGAYLPFGIASNTLLQYGTNYTKVKAEPEVVAKWEAAWKACVDTTDYTLAAGYYLVEVTGVSVSGESMYVTEVGKTYLFEIKGKSEAIENVFESIKPVKFIGPDGQVRILRDGKMYNMSGALVK